MAMFRHDVDGSLVTDEPIEGVTHEMTGRAVQYYGAGFFIAESMTRKTARILANALGGELEERPT